MKKIIIANCNPTLNQVQNNLLLKYNAIGIKSKEELNLENLEDIKPAHIFFLHWSWIIPEDVYNKYNCIVFHMTDLPYGRGGSPLQNLIVRGHKSTKISAIKVDNGIDTGDIYMKADLQLNGTATEIFKRAGNVIEQMIENIINNDIKPVKQTGEPVYFKRRKPEQSLISDEIQDIEKLYDIIRMLDADGYPHAFLENEKFRFEFTKADILSENELTANVRIIKK
ncbi:formyltransferase family protein [Mucilaginibacter sp. AW1-3]